MKKPVAQTFFEAYFTGNEESLTARNQAEQLYDWDMELRALQANQIKEVHDVVDNPSRNIPACAS